MFILIIIGVVLLASFVAAVCTKGSSLASRQEEYLEECERKKREDQKKWLAQCRDCARSDESGKYCFAIGVRTEITPELRINCRNWYLFVLKREAKK